MEALYTRLFPTMGSDDVDLCCFRTDQTRSRRLVPIDAAFSGTEIAFAEMCICQRPFFGLVDGAEEEVFWYVFVQEEC